MYRIGTFEGAADVGRSLNNRSWPAAPRAPELIRAIDIVIALAALVFLAPLMCAIALAVKLQDGGPTVFGHARVGRGGQMFKCLKFRSMVVDAETRLQGLLTHDAAARAEWDLGQKLRRDPRITPLGYLLRKTSLDELPQLLNVLRGDMSIVGPRPIVTAEIARYGRWFRHYAAARPGITGLWQTSGRNNVTYRRRVAMDVFYAKRKSVGLYLAILARTLPAVLLHEGSY